MFFMFLLFFFQLYRDHRHLHSFPTRRSSDLSSRTNGVTPGTSSTSTPSETSRRSSLPTAATRRRSEEHTSELQSHSDLVCRLLLEKKTPRRKKSRYSTTSRKSSSASPRTGMP